MRKIVRVLASGLLIFLSAAFFYSCSFYKLEKQLDPESREFLSVARYLITHQERKIFLNLPPSERKNFIEEFWKKRDPDPDTEENEFKEQYFQRIEESNKLFRGGGTPGWLQDRGRIYILLGPPTEREAYPSGYSSSDEPLEVWYYGFFPILFVDSTRSGDYKLIPLGAAHIAEINKAQMSEKPKIEKEKVVFDFQLKIDKLGEKGVLFRIQVPYSNIWLTEKDKALQATLGLSLEISDSSGKKVWGQDKDYPLSITEESLADLVGKNYMITIPVTLEPGKYACVILLENKTDQSQTRKKIKFSI
jgi:GWxTD domain-containing protein